MRKRRYKRGGEFRDQRLFIIACEGARREPEYFAALVGRNPRVRIELLHPSGEQPGGSDPQRVLQRAVSFARDNKLRPGDQMWLVLDIDRWHPKHLRDIVRQGSQRPQWFVALSQPCFELWLCFHYEPTPPTDLSCQELKTRLSKFLPQGYDVTDVVRRTETALEHARRVDSDPSNAYPDQRCSKVYLLVEELWRFVANIV